MILADYQTRAFNAVRDLDMQPRRELAAAIGYTKDFVMGNAYKEATRKDLAEFLDQLRQVITQNGPNAHTTAWVPVVQYLAVLHASHPDNTPETGKILRFALEELFTALTAQPKPCQ